MPDFVSSFTDEYDGGATRRSVVDGEEDTRGSGEGSGSREGRSKNGKMSQGLIIDIYFNSSLDFHFTEDLASNTPSANTPTAKDGGEVYGSGDGSDEEETVYEHKFNGRAEAVEIFKKIAWEAANQAEHEYDEYDEPLNHVSVYRQLLRMLGKDKNVSN